MYSLHYILCMYTRGTQHNSFNTRFNICIEKKDLYFIRLHKFYNNF